MSHSLFRWLFGAPCGQYRILLTLMFAKSKSSLLLLHIFSFWYLKNIFNIFCVVYISAAASLMFIDFFFFGQGYGFTTTQWGGWGSQLGWPSVSPWFLSDRGRTMGTVSRMLSGARGGEQLTGHVPDALHHPRNCGLWSHGECLLPGSRCRWVHLSLLYNVPSKWDTTFVENLKTLYTCK